MDYYALMDFVVDLGYRLSMSGAETFRVEESITYILGAYGIKAEVFAIPNCLIVSIETETGKPMTRMRRIHAHGNDLDSVERYNNLSRRICAEKPEPETARKWLEEVDSSRLRYSPPFSLLGHVLGSAGFSLFFGAGLMECLLAGFCGLLVGIVNIKMDALKANQFFRTIIAAYISGVCAYALGWIGLTKNPDTVIIGTLMLLVPGLLFTNAMRDIIYGDTNSGVNRIVQVILIAAAIVLGTGAAWSTIDGIFGLPTSPDVADPSFVVQELACFIGCTGFAIVFNIHGPGILLCTLGGVVSWAGYLIVVHFGGSDLTGYFIAAVISGLYAEIMARIRKYPAISYLVVSIFPLIPGASIYFTMLAVMQGDPEAFSGKLTHTIAIAGVLSVGILMTSTLFRMIATYKRTKRTH
ncbi:MAG: threonine/serine exporter ThrE family protein [Faecousia sp.]